MSQSSREQEDTRDNKRIRTSDLCDVPSPIHGLADDIFDHIFLQTNCFDLSGLVCTSKKMHNIFFKYASIIIAQKPEHLKKVTDILQNIFINSINALLRITQVVVWDFPLEKEPFPIQPEFFKLVSQCPNITRLAIGKGRELYKCSVDDFLLLANCTKLELLEIDHCSLNNIALSVLKSMPYLRSCRIRGHDGTAGKPILQILKESQRYSKSLQKIGFWQEKGKISVRDFCGLSGLNLTELILSSCILIGSPEDLQYRAQHKIQQTLTEAENDEENTKAFESLKNFPLNRLGLFFTELPDKHFSQLLEIKTLTSLHVGGCWVMNMEVLRNITNLPNLINLSLSRVSTLTYEGIEHIANHPCISTLRLSNLPLIRDNDIIPLIKMKSLTRLDVDNCRNLSDVALNHISQCTNLETLVLLDLPQITNQGILAMELLDCLKQFVIKKCIQITVNGVRELESKHMNAWIGLLKISFVQTNV